MKTNASNENVNDIILIAEDSPTQAEQLKYLLEKNHYTVIVTNDGKEALKKTIKFKPALVISDILMPEMNGYEFCKKLKSDECIMDIPVILLTSLSRSEDVLEGISCGADNFITKPYNEDYLLSHIKQILANRKIYKNEKVRIGVEIVFGGKRRFITASQQQMLTLLISTYEAAVQKNTELIQTQDDLKKLNEDLEQLVKERTAELLAEIEIRKRSEAQVRRLNRVYALLSNINQEIVRIHDEKQLINDACMIAIDKGKFQSAWIGLINNTTKKIETAASAGKKHNLIEISVQDNPILKVIESGEHFISNNILSERNLSESWKKSCTTYGFNSFAVFPLIIKAKVIGVFSIYSNEFDIFDNTEISLLDEMTNDISFALIFIQKEREQKEAEREITLLAHSLKSIKECVSITDNEDKIIFVNQSFLDTYGYTENELVGQNITLIRSDKNPPEITKNILTTTKEGGWRGELTNKKKDGSEFPILLSTTVVNDRNGKPLALIGVAIDITESKKVQKDLVEAKEKAELSDKIKTDFLAQMSHEIRTPINIIYSNVNFIYETYSQLINREDVECFESIELASRRIIRTVDLILNMSELQTGFYRPNFCKLDINENILTKLSNEYRLLAEQKGINFIFKSELNKPMVYCDEYSVTQIFANLIDNAIKYTKKGKVEILVNHNNESNIFVEINDTGIGIAEEFMPKIFDPFLQEESGYTRSYEGNGLGLALVKKYCDINKAAIDVKSEKHVGSSFKVTFKHK